MYRLRHAYECYIRFIITKAWGPLARGQGDYISIINIFPEKQNLCWCLLLLLPLCLHFSEGKRCFLVVCVDSRFYISPQCAICDLQICGLLWCSTILWYNYVYVIINNYNTRYNIYISRACLYTLYNYI